MTPGRYTGRSQHFASRGLGLKAPSTDTTTCVCVCACAWRGTSVSLSYCCIHMLAYSIKQHTVCKGICLGSTSHLICLQVNGFSTRAVWIFKNPSGSSNVSHRWTTLSNRSSCNFDLYGNSTKYLSRRVIYSKMEALIWVNGCFCFL